MIAQISTVAFFAGLAAAVHAPVGDPLGNPITAPLVQVVPACKAFTIQWTPTTPNPVSILLLRGPSTNVVPLGAPLAEGIANSGSFVWTPAATLEADTTHYGLQLIDDVTGQYQYSTQFGISKDLCAVAVSSSVAAPVVEASSVVASTAEAAATEGYGYGYATETAEPSPAAPVATSTQIVHVPGYVASTGYPFSNSSIVQPTKSLSVPASLLTTATGAASATASAPAEFTGAASAVRAGLGLAGAVAGLVFML